MSGLCFAFTPAQDRLRAEVRAFVERECPPPVAREIEARRGEYPWALHRAMAAAGLHAIGVPESHGGRGGDVIDQAIVAEELARSLAAVTSIWFITSFSGAGAIGRHGTAAQRSRLLPLIARGEIQFAIALTEPGGGTDVLRAMRTRARRTSGGWLITGTKMWSTCADVADVLLLVTRTAERAKPSEGVTVFLCDARQAGIRATPIPKLGMRCLGSCEIGIEDAFVPEDQVLGEVDAGWPQLVATLNNERILVAAMCLGMGRGVLEQLVPFASDHHVLGAPLGAQQAIQHRIADVAMDLATAHLHTYRAAWRQQHGLPCGVESTMAKHLAAEAAVAAADAGIQVYGAGDELDSDMQRYWRDARVYPIGPISSEMGRNYIGERLGLPRSF